MPGCLGSPTSGRTVYSQAVQITAAHSCHKKLLHRRDPAFEIFLYCSFCLGLYLIVLGAIPIGAGTMV